MTYMALFAGIVILIGIVFISSTLRGARKEKSHTTSAAPVPPASQPDPPNQASAAFPSREGDAAYRDALRTFAKNQPRVRSGPRQSHSLTDDAYRDALRKVKKEEKPSTPDGS